MCLYHVDGYSIYFMVCKVKNKIETVYKCDAFEIFIHMRNGEDNFYCLRRPNKEDSGWLDLNEALLEVYEDENIWLTNEMRSQLKQLRNGILK